MNTEAVLAAEADLQEFDDNSQYSVASRLEIAQLLSALMKHKALVTASPGGEEFFLTSIVAVDAARDVLLLEASREQEQNAETLRRRHLLCGSSLDRIKIQFLCENIQVAPGAGGPVLKMPLPRQMLRLQRREHFRIGVPLSAGLACTITSLDSDAGQARVQLNVHEISCGGIAVVTPPELFSPELGRRYRCEIALPGGAAHVVEVEARNALRTTLPSGKPSQRAGFAFVAPTERLLAAVQRYIMGLERAQRARS